MKYLFFVLCVVPCFAESLRYSINWASGLSLGEATLRTDKGKERWDFEATMDASIPGFALRDDYRSSATPDLCSLELDKTFAHGPRKGDESIIFDQQNHTATRQTQGGGKTDLSISGCAKDALTFMQFARNELAQGRLPPQQSVDFGGLYNIRIQYTGPQKIKVGDQAAVDADRILATIRGPVTDLTVEIFFARDAARTPLLARIPLALGSFTVELIR
ncbi:MAG TPA: DUF3108 domain-containing protein [Bryobacteraceae bacterium]|jgi:hypothetical protein|nr:DUF3108 domain-containing protein [Bryobacteraceae bacterium]